MNARYMDGAGAAEYLGISISTFKRGVADDRFPKAIEVTPRTHRWDRIELDLAMAQMKAESGDESTGSDEDIPIQS